MKMQWESARQSKQVANEAASLRRLRSEVVSADSEISGLRRKLEVEQKRADRLAAELESERKSHADTKKTYSSALRKERDARIKSESAPKVVPQPVKSEVKLVSNDSEIAQLRAAIAEAQALIATMKASSVKAPRESASETPRRRALVEYSFSFERDRVGRIRGATAIPKINEGDAS